MNTFKVRTSTKALIVQDRRILLNQYRNAAGEWYGMPGGGQNHGENLPDALRRECIEEIGASITVGPLRFIREYIGKNHGFAQKDNQFHQVDFIFECSVPADYTPSLGTNPDSRQAGVVWLPVDELAKYRIFPGIVRMLAMPKSAGELPVYLGDVN